VHRGFFAEFFFSTVVGVVVDESILYFYYFLFSPFFSILNRNNEFIDRGQRLFFIMNKCIDMPLESLQGVFGHDGWIRFLNDVQHGIEKDVGTDTQKDIKEPCDNHDILVERRIENGNNSNQTLTTRNHGKNKQHPSFSKHL
jgi:hypothetical protein